MNISSIIVAVVVVAFAALAVWRNLKKGAPCECGCSGKSCGCGCCGPAPVDPVKKHNGTQAKI